MIDFSSLVLAPAMETFATNVTITPLKSQPLASPYSARGIGDVRDVDVMLEDGSTIASKSYTLGIRLSEYTVAPVVGDKVTLAPADASMGLPVGDYLVDQARPDGQGGAKLVLKALQP